MPSARASLDHALGALADADALLAHARSDFWTGAAAHGYEECRTELRTRCAELTSALQELAGPLAALAAAADAPVRVPDVMGGDVLGRTLVGVAR